LEVFVRACQYEDCNKDLTGYPPAAKYCSIAHATLAKRGQEADYAKRNRGLINRRRRNREAKKARQESGFTIPDLPEEELSDGRSRPPLIDGVLRGKGTEYTGSHDPDDVDDLPWMATRNDRVVAFHSSRAEPRRYDELGRPVREGPVRAEVEFGELFNPAAAGMMYVASPAAGMARLKAQEQGNRFGPGIETPAPIHSGQLASAPHLEAKESAEIETQRAADTHTRSQAPWWRR
jgi:hypothetical protein